MRLLLSRKHEIEKARKGNFPFAFSPFRVFAIISGSLVAAPCFAHGAEELGHHWHVPAYWIEMQTQVLLMTGVAVIMLAISWLVSASKKRRSRG